MKKINFAFLLIIVGSIIGAGFSSGKEIASFFTMGGGISYFNITLTFIIFYLLLKIFMNLGQIIKPKNLFDINKNIFPKSYKFFNILLMIGLYIVIVAMIAGTNSVGELIFSNIKFPVLSIISVFFSFFILILGYDAISKLNKILVPIILVYIILISFLFVFKTDYNLVLNNEININFILKYLVLGLFYVAFNMIYPSSLIIENSKNFSRFEIKIHSFLITFVLCVIILIINFTLLHSSNEIFNADMPFLNMAYEISNFLGYSFSFILWVSILTTLISTLYVFINCFSKNKFLIISIVLTSAFIFSFFGFSYIINCIYPLQGAIGIVFIISSIKFYFSHRKTDNFNKKIKLKHKKIAKNH